MMLMGTYLITLVPPNSELLSLSSSRFSFARTEDSPAVKILMMMMVMIMMMVMMMMMMAVGGLQPTNRLGSWVEQPNRMNLSLLESDEKECHGDESLRTTNLGQQEWSYCNDLFAECTAHT